MFPPHDRSGEGDGVATLEAGGGGRGGCGG
jgi:hypothetical protein